MISGHSNMFADCKSLYEEQSHPLVQAEKLLQHLIGQVNRQELNSQQYILSRSEACQKNDLADTDAEPPGLIQLLNEGYCMRVSSQSQIGWHTRVRCGSIRERWTDRWVDYDGAVMKTRLENKYKDGRTGFRWLRGLFHTEVETTCSNSPNLQHMLSTSSMHVRQEHADSSQHLTFNQYPLLLHHCTSDGLDILSASFPFFQPL